MDGGGATALAEMGPFPWKPVSSPGASCKQTLWIVHVGGAGGGLGAETSVCSQVDVGPTGRVRLLPDSTRLADSNTHTHTQLEA